MWIYCGSVKDFGSTSAFTNQSPNRVVDPPDVVGFGAPSGLVFTVPPAAAAAACLAAAPAACVAPLANVGGAGGGGGGGGAAGALGAKNDIPLSLSRLRR